MAIDPNIALSVRGPQFESPINAMRNAMEIGAYQNKMQQQQQALQQQQQLRNFLSTANLGDPTIRNQLNVYDPSGETFKNVESGYEARGKNEMETFKLALAKYSEFRNRLGGLASANASRDEVISEVHNAVQEGLLTPEVGKHFEDTLPTDPVQLQTRLVRGARENASPEQIVAMFAPKIEFRTTGNGEEGIDVAPFSPTYKQTVIQRTSPPKTPSVQVNLPAAETEFGKGIGKGAAENLQASFQNAKSASRSTSNLERLFPLVNNSNFISGTLGDARLVVAKALGLEGATETQAFFSQMGTETAEAIKNFGAGTGLSDADREYAAGIAGGSIKLTPEAIKKILFLRQQANRASIKAYNDDRRTYALNNPNAKVDQYYQEVPVPPPPAFNPKGWGLQRDKNGNYAYVSPDGKKYEETE